MNSYSKDRSNLVLHVVTSLNFGGVERHMEILCSVVDRGVKTHRFCAIGEGGSTARRMLSAGCGVDLLRQPATIPSLASLWELFCLFRRLRPEVVHTHGSEANFHGLIAAWLAGVPVRVAEEIGIPNHSLAAKHVFRGIYNLAHRVIAISDSVKSWLIESNEIKERKAVRIYNPVALPTEICAKPGTDVNMFRLAFVGRFEPVKNPIVILDAVAMLRTEGVPVEAWLIGDGTERNMLEARAKKLGVDLHIHFFGYVDNPVNYVAKCDVYVQPSLSEGFGIGMVEAMGCGVPVLASAVGGAPEIITHGQSGWILKSTSADDLTAALRHVWQHRGNLASIGQAGRLAVLKRFEPEQYLHELEALYDEVQLCRGTR